MLTSPTAPEGYFSVRFWLEIDAPIQKKTHTPTPPKPPKVTMTALPEITEITERSGRTGIELRHDEDVVKIMKDDSTTTSLVNMDNRYYTRYVYNNPKREQEIRSLYRFHRLSWVSGYSSRLKKAICRTKTDERSAILLGASYCQ